jgi:hypothetical protein
MNPDLLQQLRDIHQPLAPSWFPPAPGWWLVALMLFGVGYAVFRAVQRHRRRLRPYRATRLHFANLQLRYLSGELDDRQVVDASNELLKRLLVRVENHPGAAQATGLDWLELLAKRFDEPDFLTARAALIGNDRFQRTIDGDVRGLLNLLESVIARGSRR